MKIKLTIPFSSEEIKQITQAAACTADGASILYIATHSSEVEKDTLFLAFEGEKTSGECFREEVMARGGYLLTEKTGDRSFTVRSVSEALFALARAHLSKLKRLEHTIGITGSVGKTTTKEVLFRLLRTQRCTHATQGNYNSEIGLPLTILSAPRETQILILEMGMNHPGELARLSMLAKPNLVIITCIGHAHIGNFGSRESIAEAKKEILLGAAKNAIALVPAEEPLLADIGCKKTVSISKKTADYSLLKSNEKEDALLRKSDGSCIGFPCKTKDTGLISAIAFSAAAASEIGACDLSSVCLEIDFSTNIFRQKEYFLRDMRIVFDAYNASFESVIGAIGAHSETKASFRSLLIGDMLELGDFADALHERVGKACAAVRDRIDQLYLFGAYAERIAKGATRDGFEKERIFINESLERPDITADQILRNARPDTCLWIKGARGLRMERILDIIIKAKGDDNHDG